MINQYNMDSGNQNEYGTNKYLTTQPTMGVNEMLRKITILNYLIISR